MQDFLGEYMAGGVIIILGLTLDAGESHYCSHVCNGMHGGAVFIRGTIPNHRLGQAVGTAKITPEEKLLLRSYIDRYGALFGVDVSGINLAEFTKLTPLSARPYRQLYAY